MEVFHDKISLPCLPSVRSSNSPSNFNSIRIGNHVYNTDIFQQTLTSKGISSQLSLSDYFSWNDLQEVLCIRPFFHDSFEIFLK